MSIEVRERTTQEASFEVEDVLGNALVLSTSEPAGPFKKGESYRAQLAPHANDVRVLDERGDKVEGVSFVSLEYAPNEPARVTIGVYL